MLYKFKLSSITSLYLPITNYCIICCIIVLSFLIVIQSKTMILQFNIVIFFFFEENYCKSLVSSSCNCILQQMF